MRITFIGAGAWGTALAVVAAQAGHEVRLWARDADQAAAMARERVNARYLPGVPLPAALQCAGGDDTALRPWLTDTELVVLGVPMAALRPWLARLAEVWPAGGPAAPPVVWLCKGFERPQAADAPGLLGHEIAQQVAPALAVGVFSGPSFAREVAQGLPTALVAASAHAHVRDALVAAFHGQVLRVYANDDVVGVEVGGAVKNVLAIATGLSDGLQLGHNARAALITRGLAEMTRLGLALGARADTFMGLTGLGDLVLTATGDLSRNRQVGLRLAQGMNLSAAVASLGHVAEGVYSARTVALRAAQLGVDVPITQAVVAVLDGQLDARRAVERLMGRDPRAE
ncbi:glycerol-3-phosphate dehydrogenase (NAD(P)+) [Tepidimonas ignava]|uniref:Glycerol-3-phosphate dehydrogenase [NAD(P)+] n=1 Tax=Tepidimonas ignava TaxID=114249 RepID=A0A4R3LP28_9BURK|nr:NAD(P)H-dependent glycerol-3-phosphate dehydrogenase [Tepidimonas ignava]TCS99746.1 glycerol-3-phosphate dehydrogenase (NAD(P)+) [Tepidimonas ignava]TSE23131.1 Glycerol-3-phosphate dehydrogenase NAD(P)+ [Tepidimonas ignava]